MIPIKRPPTRRSARSNSIIYGLTGVGKTTFLGSANDCEETSPILIVDVDRGSLVLGGKKVDIVQPENFAELQEVYDFLRNSDHKYKSVGVDTLSEFQKGLSMGTLMDEIDDEFEYTDLAKSAVPNRQHWLQSHTQLRKFIRAFRDLSYLRDRKRQLTVFLLALERMDRERGVICPSLPGVLGTECGAYVDLLARMTVQEDEDGKEVRALQFVSSTDDEGMKVLTKSRLTLRGKRIVNPTVDALMKRWAGGTEEA